MVWLAGWPKASATGRLTLRQVPSLLLAALAGRGARTAARPARR